MAEVRAHIIVSGRVQGVFYRSFTQEVASSFELRGWVRNMPDGRVEAVFEGDRDRIEKAIESCRMGPPASHVEDIDVQWEDPAGESGPFSVKYF